MPLRFTFPPNRRQWNERLVKNENAFERLLAPLVLPRHYRKLDDHVLDVARLAHEEEAAMPAARPAVARAR